MISTIMFKTILISLFICFLITGCFNRGGNVEGSDTISYEHKGSKDINDYTQKGIASWYGDKEHGNKTASGEKFSRYAYTAAHKTIPFGTVVRVTNLENGKDVVVTINDRGPFIKGRIIDLSYSSALAIDLVRTGITKVKVEVISSPSLRSNSYFRPVYTVQVGSFSSKINALSVKNELRSVTSSDDIRIERVKVKGDTYYRVRVGMFSQKSQAEKLKKKLRSYGYRGKVVLE